MKALGHRDVERPLEAALFVAERYVPRGEDREQVEQTFVGDVVCDWAGSDLAVVDLFNEIVKGSQIVFVKDKAI